MGVSSSVCPIRGSDPRERDEMARGRWAALCVALVVLLGCAESPGSDGNGDGVRQVCDIQPQAPEVEVLGKRGVVVATAVAFCDEPPNTHKIMLMLEHKSGSRWVQISASAVEHMGTCEDIPRPGREVKCQWRVFDCEPGLWRTKVHVSGEGPFGENGLTKPFYFEAPEKPEATLKCPPGDRR